MKNKFGIIAVFCLLFIYGCFHVIAPTEHWRYRLTLTVDDNGVLKSGSSVVEIEGTSTRYIPLPIPGTTGSIGLVRGEAVAVNLGEKGTLFALLTKESDSNHTADLVCELFPAPGSKGSGCAGAALPKNIWYYRFLSGKAEVPFDKLPMLVRFRDINDPKTAEKVEPGDLEKSFGPGVKLNGATIEMTRDSVTRVIPKILPSWRDKGFSEWQSSLPYGDPLKLDRSYFEKGL